MGLCSALAFLSLLPNHRLYCSCSAPPFPHYHGGALTLLKLYAKVNPCPFKLSVSYFAMVVRTENTIRQYQEGQGLITGDDRSHLPEG